MKNLGLQMVFNESSAIVYDKHTISKTIGSPASVEFDFDAAWDYMKTLQPFDPELLHFIHIHPPSFNTYSDTDVRCMKALNMAFGYSVNFWIVYQNLITYSAVCYQYHNSEVTRKKDCEKLADFIIGRILV